MLRNALLCLVVCTTPALADPSPFGATFSGRVEMGLVGGSDTLNTYVDPFFGVEATAEFTFEIGDSVTLGLVLPFDADSEDGLNTPRNPAAANN